MRKDGGSKKRKTRVRKSDLQQTDGASCGESTCNQVDRMIVEAMEVCGELSIQYDEESIQTTQTTRERCALLKVMHDNIRTEKTRIAHLRERWSDCRSQQSPGEEDTYGDAGSESTEHTANGAGPTSSA